MHSMTFLNKDFDQKTYYTLWVSFVSSSASSLSR